MKPALSKPESNKKISGCIAKFEREDSYDSYSNSEIIWKCIGVVLEKTSQIMNIYIFIVNSMGTHIFGWYKLYSYFVSFSSVCFVLSELVSFYFSLFFFIIILHVPLCFLRDTKVWIWTGEEVNRIWRKLGEGKHNQNIMYEKNPFQ